MRYGMWVIVVWLQVMAGSVWANHTTDWNPGELRLQNGTEFKGDINFNWVAQVVQYRQGAIIRAYSAFQVRSFAYFDEGQNMPRKFACVSLLDKTGHQRLWLLEEMVGGTFVVYRQAHNAHSPFHLFQVSDLITYGTLTENVDNFSYWVLSHGKLLDFPAFYRRVWPQVSRLYEAELAKDAQRMEWGVDSTIGRLRQISVYNALAQQALQRSLPNPINVGY